MPLHFSSRYPTAGATSTAPALSAALATALPPFAVKATTGQVSKRAGICHGRVAEDDFAEMVPEQWWTTVFDALYLKTDGDVVEDPEITKEEIRMLEANPAVKEVLQRGLLTARQQEHAPKVLDLCCGQGRHTLLLAERYPGLRIYGHDQSAYLISLARERALQTLPQSSSRTPPVFSVGDCRTVPYATADFDFVMIMGNSFGYFSAKDVATGDDGEIVDYGDRAVLSEINRLLKTGGQMVLDLADGDYMRTNFSPRSWEWIDDQTFVCRERTLSKDKKHLHSREVVVAVSRGVVRDQFYSERLYDRAELVELLREHGFDIEGCDEQLQKAVVEESGVNTVTAARELSQRGQDLGMMEQRLLIFAHKLRDLPSKKHSSNMASTAMGERVDRGPVVLNDTVRELIEKFRQSVLASSDADAAAANSTADANADLLKMKLHEHQRDRAASRTPSPTRPSLLGNDSNTDEDRRRDEAVIDPASYHLLPAPPFPGDQLAVIMGDTTMPCREKLNGAWNREDFDTRRKLVKGLIDCGYAVDQISILEYHADLVKDILTKPPSFVFNLCDEGFKNDAQMELHVASLLEMCSVNYSGAGPVCLGVCYDKGLVNATAAKLGVSTPSETYVILHENIDAKAVQLKDVEELVAERERAGAIHYPAFVKPMKGDNSLGITSQSICHSQKELVNYIHSLVRQYALKEFIVQEYLLGTEYSVGVIGNPETGFHFLPILQVDYTKVMEQGLEPILGWESKWDPDSPYWTEVDYVVAKRIPGQKRSPTDKKPSLAQEGTLLTGGLTSEEEEELKRSCAVLFERFGCRDYARFDWRADREVQYNPVTGERRTFALAKGPDSAVIMEDATASTLPSPSAVDNDDSVSDGATSANDALGSDSGHGGSSHASEDDDIRGRHHDSVRQGRTGADGSSSKRMRSIKLLEVNPNPGWCWDGKLAKMGHACGMEYSDMLKSILWAGWERTYGRESMAKVVATLLGNDGVGVGPEQ